MMTLLKEVRGNGQRICIVIDEVHAMIEDADYRPCYNLIPTIKEQVPDVYYLAMSATINSA